MHTNFHNVLSRTFRQSQTATSGAFTIAAWLAPSVRPTHSRRPFSRTRRRRAQAVNPSQEVSEIPKNVPRTPYVPRSPGPTRLEDPQAWIEKLEPALPANLRLINAAHHAARPEKSAEERAIDIAAFLARSRKISSVDILSYLGIEQGRWDVVMWIVKTVVEHKLPDNGKLDDLDPFKSIRWPRTSLSLDEATEQPVVAETAGTTGPLQHTLDRLTDYDDFSEDGLHFRKGALGMIWRSLGNMILAAVNDRSAETQSIMPHLLEIIAYLHHVGIIPESVYHHESPMDPFAPQQPPTLHLLSSQILTALSDAAWRAHEAASGAKPQAQYTFLGTEVPGSRYKVRTPELGLEIWLELILWSCLHGGWVRDGAAIIENMTNYKGNNRWSALYWRDTLEEQPKMSSFLSMTWGDVRSFANVRGTQANSADRLVVERTVSSELIAAYVDALINKVQVGVGDRGLEPSEVIRFLSKLRLFLHRNNLGLGATSWEATVVRLLESGGFDIDKTPDLVRKSLAFIPSYDRESEYSNAPREFEDVPGSPSYIMDGSAAPLGILHQALRIYLDKEDAADAFRALAELQELTDANKRRSLQQFFRKLNSAEQSIGRPQSFNSNLSGLDFPAYFPQIPSYILASVLDIATDSEAFDFGRWLLYSEDLDGPLVTEQMYSDEKVAPALIRFASTTGDKALVAKVISQYKGSTSPMPFYVLEAILDSQIANHRWDSVANLFGVMADDPAYGWHASHVSMLVKQLIILWHRDVVEQQCEESPSLAQAKSIFQALITGEYSPGLIGTPYRILGILCVLSSVGPEWQRLCSGLMPKEVSRRVEDLVFEADFAQILQGTTQAYGSKTGWKLIKKWCKGIEEAQLSHNPGGVWRMGRFEPMVAQKLKPQPPVDIVVGQQGIIVLRGHKLPPSPRLLRILYKKVLQERRDHLSSKRRSQKRQRSRLLEFSAYSLRAMGLSDDQIDHELEGTLREGTDPWVLKFLSNSKKDEAHKEEDELDVD